MTGTVYRTSAHLRTLRNKTDRDFSSFGGHLAGAPAEPTILYHSLLGRGRYVSGDTVSLLQRCSAGIREGDLQRCAAAAEIETLVRLSYLVTDGVDERSSIDDLLTEREARIATGEFITSLQFILTNSCNFKCDYCFAHHFDAAVKIRNDSDNVSAPKTLPPAGKFAQDRKMSLDVAERTLDLALRNRARHGGDHLAVSLFGGEPTLNKDLILHLLRRYGERQHYGVQVHWDITTNGSRLDDDLVEALSTYRVNSAVSIDYICEETGGYRSGSLPTVPWGIIRDNAARLVDAGVPVSIISVLSEQTWPYWSNRLIEWCAAVGIPEVDVLVSFQAGFFRRHSPGEVASRLLAAFDYGQQRGVLLTGYWYQTYLLILDETKWALHADYKTCPAIGRQLSIEPDGLVFACKATKTSFGHIDDWENIFLSPGYRSYAMRAYRNAPECGGCELEGTCSGGSAGQLEEENNAIDHMNSSYCEFMRHVVQGLLERELEKRSHRRRIPVVVR